MAIQVLPTVTRIMYVISAFRLVMLSKTLQYWTGPMSLAIYVNRSELDALVKTIYTDFPLLLERKNIDMHFVLESGVSMVIYPVFNNYDILVSCPWGPVTANGV